MDIYTLILIIALLAFTAYIASKWFSLRTKALVVNQAVQTAKANKSTKFADMVENLPMALDQAQKIYAAQLAAAQEQAGKLISEKKITEEDAKAMITATMKPFKDKIDLLLTIDKIPAPILQVGANIGDTLTITANKMIKEFGKEGL